jgi:hypothetical protein
MTSSPTELVENSFVPFLTSVRTPGTPFWAFLASFGTTDGPVATFSIGSTLLGDSEAFRKEEKRIYQVLTLP